MSAPFLDWLFPSVPAKFVSRYPLAESVERLRAATVTWHTAALFRQEAYGTVSAEDVRLVRRGSLSGQNAPRFVGSFRSGPKGVVLTGRFVSSDWVRAVTILWVGFNGLLAVVACFAVMVKPSLPALGAIFLPLGMAAFGITITKLDRWSARRDIPWLSQVIQEALSEPTPKPLPPPRFVWLKKTFLDLAGQ